MATSKVDSSNETDFIDSLGPPKDMTCQLFAEDLFHAIWFIFDIDDEIKRREVCSHIISVPSCVSEEILKSVVVYMLHKRDINIAIFTEQSPFLKTKSDILWSLYANAERLKKGHKQRIMDYFLFYCAAMAEMILYLKATGNPDVDFIQSKIPVLFTRIFENFFEKEFFRKNGWAGLKRVSHELCEKFFLLEDFIEDAQKNYTSFIEVENPLELECHPRLGVPTPEAMMDALSKGRLESFANTAISAITEWERKQVSRAKLKLTVGRKLRQSVKVIEVHRVLAERAAFSATFPCTTCKPVRGNKKGKKNKSKKRGN